MQLVPLLLAVLACTKSADVKTDKTHDTSQPAVVPLEDLVTIDALIGHLEALQDIADANDGHRSGVSPGYFASLNYAEGVLEEAGYSVERVPFQYPGWEQLGPTELEADGQVFVAGEQVAAMYYSPPGEADGPLEAVDLVLPPTPTTSSTSGCEPEDFNGFTPGSIALLQRGECAFTNKVENAEAAGAIAAVVFNEGQGGRRDLEGFQVEPGNSLTIPVVCTDFDTGDLLAAAVAAGPVQTRVVVDALSEIFESENLIVETEGGDPDNVLVVGGHLDSVPEGPGINDNGSGTALVIELAVQMAVRDVEPRNKVRFALWGAEELGLLGSTAYVEGLPESEVDKIAAKLNFDMLASPNGAPMIYDGDGSTFGIPGPVGSPLIEDIFAEWFEINGEVEDRTSFDGRSDYQAFIAEGIPAGGLFSGADDEKTPEQESAFGGTVDQLHDPCYHKACDDIGNVNEGLYETLSKAAAYGTDELAEIDWDAEL